MPGHTTKGDVLTNTLADDADPAAVLKFQTIVALYNAHKTTIADLLWGGYNNNGS